MKEKMYVYSPRSLLKFSASLLVLTLLGSLVSCPSPSVSGGSTDFYKVSIATGITGGTISAKDSDFEWVGEIPSGSGIYMGSTIFLSNIPYAGYVLVYYTVNGKRITGNSFTLNGDVTVSAVFTNSPLTVTIATNITGGTVSASFSKDAQGYGYAGTTVTLSNTPDLGYTFDYYVIYTEDGAQLYTEDGAQFPGSSFTLNENVTVSAVFNPVPSGTYSVSIATGITGGTVSASFSNSAQGYGPAGTSVTLSNTPNSGYALDYYTVNGEQISGNDFTLDKNVTVSAVFNQIVYDVNIATGITGGTVSASPESGIWGTSVTLSNTPDLGYTFGYYTVDGTWINGSSFTLNKNVTVSAVFNQIVYDVSIATGITGGTISASPTSGPWGTSVTLSNTPNPGYALDYYTVDGTQITGNSFILDKNVTVSAVFNQMVYDVSIATGITGGTVRASPESGLWGTSVTLSNTPDLGYMFNGYTIDGGQVTSNSSFTLNKNVTVSAVFNPVPAGTYMVRIATGITGGTVSASFSKNTQGYGYAGTTVTLSNTPAADYILDHYTINGERFTGNSFTLNAHVLVSAVFVRTNLPPPIGNPSVKLYQDGSTNPLTEGGSTTVSRGTGTTYTVGIASGTYSEITWYLNGRIVAGGATATSITLFKETNGTYLVTVEATLAGPGQGKNTGSHTFVVTN
ncbi:hypothetical protein AGMMS49928_18480 [Spirochaetia bacterium]|nr:hypothetical protein AGMMS49928_18480 [Spirochaetia bacterium]